MHNSWGSSPDSSTNKDIGRDLRLVDAAKLQTTNLCPGHRVGLQNSSSGVVLVTSHFTSPMVALPAALFVVIMNIMGSSLAFFWRYM